MGNSLLAPTNCAIPPPKPVETLPMMELLERNTFSRVRIAPPSGSVDVDVLPPVKVNPLKNTSVTVVASLSWIRKIREFPSASIVIVSSPLLVIVTPSWISSCPSVASSVIVCPTIAGSNSMVSATPKLALEISIASRSDRSPAVKSPSDSSVGLSTTKVCGSPLTVIVNSSVAINPPVSATETVIVAVPV